ncbi:MAG: hypothetical protein CSA23_03005 [Deltaproteobacteria bacterium]|nr:MAG: hypothetical protein CSA23_03005 [Deltaproteobacteria bacterium]
MPPATFSIIVSTLNAQQTIAKCIDSIRSQTYPFIELIIIDGGSTDDTLQIISANHRNVAYWESEPDKGIYHAFNKGIKKSRNDWIYFLGSDDFLWSKTVIESVAESLDSIPERIRFVYGNVHHLADDGRVIKTTGCEWNPSIVNEPRTPIDHQALFHHRSLFEDHGRYDLNYKVIADYEFQLRVLSDNPYCCQYIHKVIAGHQYGGISTDPRNRLKIFKDSYFLRRKYSIPTNPYTTLFKYFGAFFWSTLSICLGRRLTQILENALIRIFNNPNYLLRRRSP